MSMIEIGNIITLDNEKEYLLAEGITYKGTDYVYAVGVDEDEMPDPTDVEIYQVVKEDGDEYVQELGDENLKKVLKKVFLKIMLEDLS